MTKTRSESDSFGKIEVPDDRYWGAQTQRSLGNFKIGWEKQPQPIIRALGIIKHAAAEANMALGRLEPELGEPIRRRRARWWKESSMGISRWRCGRPAREPRPI